jgi:putative copper resistance protein D
MYRLQVNEQAWIFAGTGAVLSLVVFLFWFASQPHPQYSSMPEVHHHHMGMSMMHDEAMTPAVQAKLLADKKESEFNHHLAGFFVLLAGTFILFQGTLMKRWPMVKYVWPGCFVLSGIFVLVWSDTELWPFGHRQWLEALQNNSEVLQHKMFSLLLLALGVIEWQRVRGVLQAAWSAWVFPVVAVGGSVLLLFHQHEVGMHGPDHMAVMSRIQLQHLGYSVLGIGAGLAKGLATARADSQRGFRHVWPMLIIVLGAVLMGYRE